MAFTLTDTILLRMCEINSFPVPTDTFRPILTIKRSARNTSWRSRRVTTFTRDARSASGGPRPFGSLPR